MTVTNTLHVNLNGTAREALEFYHSVFGGDLVAVPYGEAPGAPSPEHVIWGQVATPDGFRIMAYDVQTTLDYDQGVNSYYSSLRCTEAADVERFVAGLSDGASIEVPLGPSAFSPLYAKLTDRFGVTWVIDHEVPYAG